MWILITTFFFLSLLHCLFFPNRFLSLRIDFEIQWTYFQQWWTSWTLGLRCWSFSTAQNTMCSILRTDDKTYSMETAWRPCHIGKVKDLCMDDEKKEKKNTFETRCCIIQKISSSQQSSSWTSLLWLILRKCTLTHWCFIAISAKNVALIPCRATKLATKQHL